MTIYTKYNIGDVVQSSINSSHYTITGIQINVFNSYQIPNITYTVYNKYKGVETFKENEIIGKVE